MDGHVEWVKGLEIACTAQSGQQITLCGDAAAGPSPMETVLLALGSCSLIDVIEGLRSHEATGASVDLRSERASEAPRVFTSVEMVYTVEGRGLPEKLVERLVKLSQDRYCSVGGMIGQVAELTYSVTVNEAPAA